MQKAARQMSKLGGCNRKPVILQSWKMQAWQADAQNSTTVRASAAN